MDVRGADETGNGDRGLGGGHDFDERPGRAQVEDCRQRLARLTPAGGLERDPAVRGHAERDRRIGDGVAADQFENAPPLGRLGFEELTPSRRIEEQVAHTDDRADRRPAPRPPPRLAAFHPQTGAAGFVGAPADDLHTGNRPDGGQRLAAEPERPDGEQIIGVLQLGGGVSGDRQRQLGGGNAAAVIGDFDQSLPGPFEADLDARCPGIESVLDQLAYDRRRPFDDFARGDGRSDILRKHMDRHGSSADRRL
jgi:hypothetical protein